jgi:hypothetical protein
MGTDLRAGAGSCNQEIDRALFARSTEATNPEARSRLLHEVRLKIVQRFDKEGLCLWPEEKSNGQTAMSATGRR